MPDIANAEALLGAVVGGRFRLERVIGRGTAATVFEAHAGDRRVAVKLLAERAGRESCARLLREARLAASIENPHVLSVEDAGTDEALSVAYVVMPLLEGRTLAELLDRTGPLSPRVAVRIALDAAAGLAAAHAAGVVHRDVKPSNLFLCESPSGEVTVVVCDFGIAKPMELFDDSNLTWTGHFLGSPLYMSPEQAKSSKRVDERTDVWSLGVTLYEMLAGRVPHADVRALSELIVGVCTRDSPSVQDPAPWVAPGLAVALHRALRRDRDVRWPTMARFRRALAPFADSKDELCTNDLVACSEEETALVLPRAELIAGSPAAGSGADEAIEDDPLIGRTIGRRYRVLRRLGRGGMGAVYEAECPGSPPLALKVIARDATRGHAEVEKRFVREALAAKAIEHPNVVRVLETLYDDDLDAPVIVMELVDGIDCSTLFKRSAPVEPLPLVRLFVQAARGIEAAHARGVIHRDIKPGNLLVRVDRETAEVTIKVGDFGIAKQLHDGDDSQSELTLTGRLVGSPAYMSPEQALSAKNVDVRTDVWSLGVSLYEGLTGRRAWHGHASLGEIILAICTESVPPVRDVAQWVPDDVARIVDRALEHDTDARWQTMSELREALEACAGTEPVLRTELRIVDETRRGQRRAGGEAAESADGSGRRVSLSTMSGTARETASAKSFAKRSLVLLFVAATLGATIFVTVERRSDTEPPLGSTAAPEAEPAPQIAPTRSSEPAETQSSGSNVSATLTILPRAAVVTIDGVAVRRSSDSVLLEGKPGQVFRIVASLGNQRVKTAVALAADGTAIPGRIALPDPRSGASRPTAAPTPAPLLGSASASPRSGDPLKPPARWGE